MSIGSEKSEIETPALLIDLDVMEANIQRMSDYFRGRDSQLRPHAKTHKCPIIAHKQIAAGAIGVCCQKLGEAEVMVDGGVRDILITNEIVEPSKIERLVSLNRYANVKVAVDNIHVARATADIAKRHEVKQRVVVEVDVRNMRCGAPPGRPAVDLAKEVAEMDGLDFRGVMGYEGPFLDVPDSDQRRAGARELLTRLMDTVDMITKEGVGVEIVSAGSTGTFNIAGEFPGITEVEAGSYVFMDSTYRKLERLGFNCSLSVLATVISRPIPERVIVDAGWKSITPEFGMPEVKGMENAKLARLSEEHGVINADPSADLNVGDKIELIPSHCCTTVNLHDSYYGIRSGHVETMWPIPGRGKSK
jgi:D-serine deaminase-like pyridoxal phosphate-dependent protein